METTTCEDSHDTVDRKSVTESSTNVASELVKHSTASDGVSTSYSDSAPADLPTNQCLLFGASLLSGDGNVVEAATLRTGHELKSARLDGESATTS